MWTIFHTEASGGWGGQEIRILAESLGMRARGHRVVIIAEAGSGIMEKAAGAGLETVPVSFRKKDYPKTFVRLARLMGELGADFVNTHSSRDSWLASLAAKASPRGPFVIRTRHISTPVATNLAASIIYRRLPDGIVTTAEAIRRQLITRNGVDPDRVVTIPTGVDTGVFDPARGYGDVRGELGLAPGTPLVGMVSVLRSWKGHDYFIEAAALVAREVPEARFLVAGDGPRRDDIRRIIAERGLAGKVLMMGHREDVPAVLASLDVFVQPSYANEGIPQSVMQAMAMEVPVVASDLPPFRELVTDGDTGLLVPARDPRALAERITLLLGDRALGTRLGKDARRLVTERFSVERMLDSTEELYGRISRVGRGGMDEEAAGGAGNAGAAGA